MTGAPDRGPLHLDPPSVLSDESLGERLAALARSSTPTASPRARRRWGLPVAGAVFALATAGATFGADQVRHHDDRPQPVVPATHLDLATVPSPAAPTATDEPVDRVGPVTTPSVGGQSPISTSHRRTGASTAAPDPGDDGHDGRGSDDSEGAEPSDDGTAATSEDGSEDGSEDSEVSGHSGHSGGSGDGGTHDGSDPDGASGSGSGGTGEHDG